MLLTREPIMDSHAPLLASQFVVQVCLFLVAAIAMFGGALQMYLGEPQVSPRLDNVHRFMAGVYFGSGLISLWAALTVAHQGTLVFLIAFCVLLAGTGRLISIARVGMPQPRAVWIGYLVPELLLPWILAIAQTMTNEQLGWSWV
jgi:hypothetical protein